MIERVVLVAGTRPEFIKLNPLAIALAAAGIPATLITTGQHWSVLMKDAFLSGLNWPCPVESLEATSREPLGFLSELFLRLPPRLRPTDLVVVEGDTTSVLAGALVANKLGLRLGHLEAGLRSYDLRMPEEHNRRLCDGLAEELYAPTDADAGHLRSEQCPGHIYVTGNTVLDAVRQNIARAEVPETRDFVLVTVHRQDNVDDPRFLAEILRFMRSLEIPCIFPVHPRTEEKLKQSGLWNELGELRHVQVIPPVGYLASLGAQRAARVIVTDSGGVQEEATAPEIRTPVIVLRRSTERTAAIDAGFSLLAPTDAGRILALVQDLSWFKPTAGSPFGDGHAAEKIVDAIAPLLSS